MMYGQMTAGCWIYIGSQGIVQGTYETFAEAGRQHYGGSWAGRWILTAGLGGMGGAQPLAATMAGASMLAIECQQIAHRDAACARAISTGRRRISTTRWRSFASMRERKRGRVGRPPRQRGGNPAGARARARPAAARPGHRPDVRARSRQRLSAGRLDGRALEGGAARPRAARGADVPPPRSLIAVHVRAMLDVPRDGHSRRSTTATTSGRSRSTRASRTRSSFRASCRRTSGRSSAKARDRSAGSRCRATRRTSTRPTAR